MTAAAVTLTAPEGSAWEFLVLFLVVILGPPLVERARVPGLIGLLVGGFLIGPHGFGLLDAGSTTIPDLGQLGLLYLMFVAGVELDLALLREHRRSAVLFGVMTFAFPMAFGTAAGALLGWEVAAALLLGSLLASHTLVLYPLIRKAGLANDPVVASAVGATVLTDTLALIILAVIAGTESGTGSSAEVALQLVLGMTMLGVFCFVVLPWLIGHAFQFLGGDRAVRYVISVAAFLAAAVVAETFGIEGIVGAFFAGLALNRLVPSHGPLMNRIDFFGGAVFVPVFLVSVGLLLDPSVMFQAETLGLAAAFIAACLGGKLIAAQLTRPLLGATAGQAGVVFALTVPQAAATLASTTVGFKIGLFSESVVNAVLVLILVSIVVATLVAEREKVRVQVPPTAGRSLGEHVLVAVADFDAAPLGLRLARAIADREAGVVDVIRLEPHDASAPKRQGELDRLSGLCRRLGIDADPAMRVTDHQPRAAVLAANDLEASLLLVAGDCDEDWAELTPLSVAPLAIVRGAQDRSLQTVRVVAGGGDDGVAALIAAALPARVERVLRDDVPGDLEPRDVGIAVITHWDDLTGPTPPDDVGLVLVSDQERDAQHETKPPRPIHPRKGGDPPTVPPPTAGGAEGAQR